MSYESIVVVVIVEAMVISIVVVGLSIDGSVVDREAHGSSVLVSTK